MDSFNEESVALMGLVVCQKRSGKRNYKTKCKRINDTTYSENTDLAFHTDTIPIMLHKGMLLMRRDNCLADGDGAMRRARFR